METLLQISAETTAVVVIDLQKGITAMPTAPYSSKTVIENTVKILNIARKKSMAVFLVHVTPSPDFKDGLRPVVEHTFAFKNLPVDWADYVPDLNIQPTDFLITKRQWGAFYGTELDLQLRRRKIKTILLCGISTSKGVESTARDAYERGYNQIFIEDAMAARTVEEHDFPLKHTFPQLGLVRRTREIVEAMEKQ